MEKMYRDFTLCENCGERCYLGNKLCEDCANDEVDRWVTHKQVDCNTIQEQSDLIEELKAKLAESEKEIALQENTISNLIEDNRASQEWYKKQLAEKEKENDVLQDKLHSYYEEIMNKGTCGLCEYVRTDYKISFAVELLVNIQKYISDNPVGAEQECFGREINGFIDNQIKAIKEMK